MKVISAAVLPKLHIATLLVSFCSWVPRGCLAAAQHYDLRSTLECGVSVDLESILGLPGAERGGETGQAQAAT